MTTEQTPANSNETTVQVAPEVQIENACRQIMGLRQRPLLVLYYPTPYGQMTQGDIKDCYQTFRTFGIRPEQPLAKLDVLIHTFGGDPVAAFRLA